MNYAVLLGLSLFFGFAFEEFFGSEDPPVPGGIRTFPLLSLTGAALYLIEPHYLLAFIAGLFVLGTWVFLYIRNVVSGSRKPVDGPLIIPVCVLIAYVLGPVALTQPLWTSFALVVGAVLLVGSRKWLHALVARVPEEEAITLGQFLLLVGVVLPLLYGAPPIPHTNITPFNVWLAVVAVSTLSYLSYVLQRYVLPSSGILVAATLGGLYSSTATTVVLARTARDEGVMPEITAGIVAATAMMYVRMVVIVAIFNFPLARAVVVPLLALGIVAAVIAGAFAARAAGIKTRAVAPSNPLRLGTAAVFAVLLIAISLLSKWVQAHAGAHGVLALAAVVGVTDVDPFVVSLAQSGAASVGLALSAVAIVIAASSNNLLKAVYTVAFTRRSQSVIPAAVLGVLCVLGLAAAWIMAR
ncbi:MAG TPA: DUF4010 domain-containing protein [Candidatus Baltobacteraceae bacterium]|nr:DUF4010 domain-containing protein [Candidatus Baltobacteraceae bacterium]